MQIDLAALSLPTTGRLYDLSSGWWRHMPGPDAHPLLEVLTYRTPRGLKNQGDIPIFSREGNGEEGNSANTGMISDLVMASSHTGTHMDALAHATCGADHRWHGGAKADEMLGDFGPLSADASELPPIVARGIVLDVPALLGQPTLTAGQPVGVAEIEGALARQGSDVRRGDVVLVRTGLMSRWPDADAMEEIDGAGLSLEGARWMSERGVVAMGSDTGAFEVLPSRVAGNPLPVHWHLMGECGIPIMEWVNCEELARDGAHEFLFVALPVNLRGATGSMLRPIALV